MNTKEFQCFHRHGASSLINPGKLYANGKTYALTAREALAKFRAATNGGTHCVVFLRDCPPA